MFIPTSGCMLMAEAEAGKLMAAKADRPYADGRGQGREVDGGQVVTVFPVSLSQ